MTFENKKASWGPFLFLYSVLPLADSCPHILVITISDGKRGDVLFKQFSEIKPLCSKGIHLRY